MTNLINFDRYAYVYEVTFDDGYNGPGVLFYEGNSFEDASARFKELCALARIADGDWSYVKSIDLTRLNEVLDTLSFPDRD